MYIERMDKLKPHRTSIDNKDYLTCECSFVISHIGRGYAGVLGGTERSLFSHFFIIKVRF